LEEAAGEISRLLTDIRLGSGTDGWKVAERARQLYPKPTVIYMTGDSHVQWQSRGVPKSILLSKPFALSQLTTVVSELGNLRGLTQLSDLQLSLGLSRSFVSVIGKQPHCHLIRHISIERAGTQSFTASR
jgi:DNA-binding LytR/AlgR family response regulator